MIMLPPTKPFPTPIGVKQPKEEKPPFLSEPNANKKSIQVQKQHCYSPKTNVVYEARNFKKNKKRSIKKISYMTQAFKKKNDILTSKYGKYDDSFIYKMVIQEIKKNCGVTLDFEDHIALGSYSVVYFFFLGHFIETNLYDKYKKCMYIKQKNIHLQTQRIRGNKA